MMRDMMRAKLMPALLLGCVCLLLVACEETTIAKINEDPGRYTNKEVSLRGTVNNSFGLVGQGVYELDDGTARCGFWWRRAACRRRARVCAPWGAWWAVLRLRGATTALRCAKRSTASTGEPGSGRGWTRIKTQNFRT